MYCVTVYRKWFTGKKESVDQRDFEIGTWKEIGFWLDHYGYIDADYEVVVTFS